MREVGYQITIMALAFVTVWALLSWASQAKPRPPDSDAPATVVALKTQVAYERSALATVGARK
jgi:hypothetical protein